jgi:broad specificity phosphatase PhoE
MIFMARHGQTAHNAEGRFQGAGAMPLDEVGVAQAHALADVARGHGIVALWCSPLLRARQTAEIVGAALGLEAQADARFAEHDTGAWTDRLKADVEAEDPATWAAYGQGGEKWTFPGGENLETLMQRVIEGLEMVTQTEQLPALVVCHRGVIRAAQSHAHLRGLATFHEWPVPNGALLAL